jgi:hypothetical protein
VDAAATARARCEVPVGAAPVELPFGDRAEDVRDELPVRGAEVEADVDGDEVPAAVGARASSLPRSAIERVIRSSFAAMIPSASPASTAASAAAGRAG